MPSKLIIKNNRFVWRLGGYFFVLLSLPNAYPALKQAKQNSEHSANLKYSLEFCFLRLDVIKLLTTIIVM